MVLNEIIDLLLGTKILIFALSEDELMKIFSIWREINKYRNNYNGEKQMK